MNLDNQEQPVADAYPTIEDAIEHLPAVLSRLDDIAEYQQEKYFNIQLDIVREDNSSGVRRMALGETINKMTFLRAGGTGNVILPLSLRANYHRGDNFLSICEHYANTLPKGSIVRLFAGDASVRYNFLFNDLLQLSQSSNPAELGELPVAQWLHSKGLTVDQLEAIMCDDDVTETDKTELLRDAASLYQCKTKELLQEYFQDPGVRAGIKAILDAGHSVILDASSTCTADYDDNARLMANFMKEDPAFSSGFERAMAYCDARSRAIRNIDGVPADGLMGVRKRINKLFVSDECVLALALSKKVYQSKLSADIEGGEAMDYRATQFAYPFGSIKKHPFALIFKSLIDSYNGIGLDYVRIKCGVRKTAHNKKSNSQPKPKAGAPGGQHVPNDARHDGERIQSNNKSGVVSETPVKAETGVHQTTGGSTKGGMESFAAILQGLDHKVSRDLSAGVNGNMNKVGQDEWFHLRSQSMFFTRETAQRGYMPSFKGGEGHKGNVNPPAELVAAQLQNFKEMYWTLQDVSFCVLAQITQLNALLFPVQSNSSGFPSMIRLSTDKRKVSKFQQVIQTSLASDLYVINEAEKSKTH